MSLIKKYRNGTEKNALRPMHWLDEPNKMDEPYGKPCISIRSLKLLFNDMKTDFNIKYFMKEVFFSIIAWFAIGGLHDHSALQFKYKLRNYLMGRKTTKLMHQKLPGWL